ncbi:MAG: hypothetical protein KAS11_01360 [Candidatus Aenigmarchaeota archaeon]|nr:hypothetical protein [Candidatus Aenigmarchaeota archaeon]MCK5042916.1 hypothetical protein [Candidatus Aenigmarchaeota archaeon]NOQ37833.1 hypothetical protein [archaeon]
MAEENVSFETIKAEEIQFGKNNFLEIAKKKAITEDGENVFLSISRGFFSEMDGEKRKKFRSSIAIPDEKEIIDAVMKAFENVIKAKE